MRSKPWLWNQLEEPRPSDWGVGMTVCIAVLCDWMKGIVSVSDHMLGTEDFTADNLAIKIDSLTSEWKIMFAANDLSSVVPVIEEASKNLLPYTSQRDLDEVATVCQTAFLRQIRRRADSEILNRYGLNVDSFIERGLKKLGTSLFRDLAQEIKAIKLDCQFLIYGFDSSGDGHIFSLQDPGEIKYWDKAGMWAIGSGKYNALSSLFFNSCSFLPPATSAIYHACEAKFMCESSPGVGKRTFVTFLRHGYKERYLDMREISAIRLSWNAHGRPKMPPDIDEKIGKMLENLEKVESEDNHK